MNEEKKEVEQKELYKPKERKRFQGFSMRFLLIALLVLVALYYVCTLVK